MTFFHTVIPHFDNKQHLLVGLTQIFSLTIRKTSDVIRLFLWLISGCRGSFPAQPDRKEVHVPATSNSPDFGLCPAPLCPLVAPGRLPVGDGCKRKAAWATRWSCFFLAWEDRRRGTGLWPPQSCGVAPLPAHSTEAKGRPPLVGGKATGCSNYHCPFLWSCPWKECHCPHLVSQPPCPLLDLSSSSPTHWWGSRRRNFCSGRFEKAGHCPTCPFSFAEARGCGGPSRSLYPGKSAWEGCSPAHRTGPGARVDERESCKSGRTPPARPGSRCALFCSTSSSAGVLSGDSTWNTSTLVPSNLNSKKNDRVSKFSKTNDLRSSSSSEQLPWSCLALRLSERGPALRVSWSAIGGSAFIWTAW